MKEETYGVTIETNDSMEVAEERVRAALASEGFGVLTEIDVQATLKAKLDVERTPYKILGACNPALANRALGIDERIGLLLPCNVVIEAPAPNKTVVSVLDPDMMSTMSDAPDIGAIAAEARERLLRALAAVEAG